MQVRVIKVIVSGCAVCGGVAASLTAALRKRSEEEEAGRLELAKLS